MTPEQLKKWILIVTSVVVGILWLCIIVTHVAAVDGSAVFFIKGVTVQDNTIFIGNGTEVNLSYLPDHTENVAAVNPGVTYVNTLPDGWSEPVPLSAGEYTAYLRQGNADQPEEQQFTIGDGITRVVFMGAAYASGDEGCCSCHNVTVVDREGYTIHHPEINHTETLGEGCVAYRKVIDIPAWDEIIFIPPVTHTVCYPEVNYTQKQSWYYTKSGGWQVTTPWKTMKCPAGENVFPRRCEERIVVVSEAHCDTIIDEPVSTRIVHHDEVSHIEEYTYTREWDVVVVDVPEWDEQVGAITHEERVCGQKLVCPCGCVRK